MQPFVLDPTDPEARAAAVDAIICEEVTVDRTRLLHKGHRVTIHDVESLARVDRPLHAVRLGSDDVHEDVAGLRLARAIAGAGVRIEGPKLSRVNVVAERKGLLRIDSDRLAMLNGLPGVAIFTLLDRLPVLPGKILAGAKITPVAVPESVLAEAERIASGDPVIEVKAFLPLRVGVVTTEGMTEKVQQRFREIVRQKIGWYGGSVSEFVDLPADQAAVSAAIQRLIGEGAQLVLTGGGNTIDPLDATLLALGSLGAELTAFGAAAHPGSMFWLAHLEQVPIFNLASCSMYSKATSADLVLPWIMAGERVTAADMARLGHGGLLEGKEMSFRFPPYELEAAAESET